jgi:phosphoesterase RecJ-like protein
MKKTKTLKSIWEILDKKNNFLIITHKNPDGDAIGSLLGLYYFLKEKEKNVYIYIPNGIPYFYQFLVVDEIDIYNGEKDLKFNVAIFLDCGDRERMGEYNGLIKEIPLIINIDHHPTNTFFGNLNLVDPSSASVTEILTNFILRYKGNISQKVAQCFLTGLITDTGSFRFSNTNIKALKTAIKLIERGADISYISKNIYERKNLSSLYLLGRALLRLKVENNIGYSYLSNDDMEEFNSKIEDTEGIVDTLRTIRDAKLIVFLYPISSSYTKISLRSKSTYINVADLAKRFGGGGHKEAAGFEIEGKPEEILLDIIKKLSELIMEYESLPTNK